MTSENIYTEIVAERGATVIPDLLRGNGGNVGEIGALLDIAADEITRLRKELAECREDAERYRTLKRGGLRPRDVFDTVWLMEVGALNDLDAACDTARKGEGEET